VERETRKGNGGGGGLAHRVAGEEEGEVRLSTVHGAQNTERSGGGGPERRADRGASGRGRADRWAGTHYSAAFYLFKYFSNMLEFELVKRWSSCAPKF
jgi:hypothetical protein